jgi:predicted transcriptional regulator
MRRSSQHVTDTELAMLQVLWKDGSATRRQIADSLYPDGDAIHYATVQNLLKRLEAKGYVRHQRREGVLIFTAAVSREELISRRLQDVADKLCEGSLTPLMMNLVRNQPLTPREIQELQALIEQLRRAPGRGGKAR